RRPESNSLGINAHPLAVAPHPLEADRAVHFGEQRIVAAASRAHAGVNFRSALADQNASGGDKLTVAALHAQAFRNAVTTVLRRTDGLLLDKKMQVHFQRFRHLVPYSFATDSDNRTKCACSSATIP